MKLFFTIAIFLGLFATPSFGYNKDQLIELLNTKKCEGCDLSAAFFKGIDLQNANLKKANLRGTSFYNANLEKVNFQNANLAWVYLEGSKLKGANFEGATWVNGQKCEKGSIGKCITKSTKKTELKKCVSVVI